MEEYNYLARKEVKIVLLCTFFYFTTAWKHEYYTSVTLRGNSPYL